MSGLLGQLGGNILAGGQSGGQPTAISGIIQQIVAGSSGGNSGVAALVSKFQAAGLGSNVQSWVSSGQNQPVSADQLTKVFSPDEIQNWASQAGTSPNAILQVLSEALPKAVDHVTPGGQVPPQTADINGMLRQFMQAHGLPTNA
jgi:uncharacterized protein YidB (DUF937 family)